MPSMGRYLVNVFILGQDLEDPVLHDEEFAKMSLHLSNILGKASVHTKSKKKQGVLLHPLSVFLCQILTKAC